jgi:hypothetical protein
MTHAEFRTKFRRFLNRSDCTDVLADDFTDAAYNRLNRILDHHVREASFQETTVADTDRVLLPSDAGKRVIEVEVDGTPIVFQPDRTSKMTYLTAYTRQGNWIILNQGFPAGTVINVRYWRNFSRPVDSGTNDLLETMEPLLRYHVLVEAGLFFEHESTEKWATAADRLLAEAVQEFYDREAAFAGGQMVVQPPMGAGSDY